MPCHSGTSSRPCRSRLRSPLRTRPRWPPPRSEPPASRSADASQRGLPAERRERAGGAVWRSAQRRRRRTPAVPRSSRAGRPRRRSRPPSARRRRPGRHKRRACSCAERATAPASAWPCPPHPTTPTRTSTPVFMRPSPPCLTGTLPGLSAADQVRVVRSWYAVGPQATRGGGLPTVDESRQARGGSVDRVVETQLCPAGPGSLGRERTEPCFDSAGPSPMIGFAGSSVALSYVVGEE